MTSQEYVNSPRSAAVTAVGVDHVRLSYDYRDCGDYDGFASLLDEDFRIDFPGLAESTGRTAVLERRNAFGGPPFQHRIHQVVADGDSVIALGRLVYRSATAPDAGRHGHPDDDLAFADHFTISDVGMLLSCCRYHRIPPSSVPSSS
ncbi:nuclear transport factor 2 family protein [Streptomyces sp. O3]